MTNELGRKNFEGVCKEGAIMNRKLSQSYNKDIVYLTHIDTGSYIYIYMRERRKFVVV